MKFSLISKVAAISALLILSLGCNNTATQNTPTASTTPSSASSTPAGPAAAQLAQSWTLVNFGAPW